MKKFKVLINEWIWQGQVEQSHCSYVCVIEGDHVKELEEMLDTIDESSLRYYTIEFADIKDNLITQIMFHADRNAEFTANFWHKPTISLTSEGNTLIMQFGELKDSD